MLRSLAVLEFLLLIAAPVVIAAEQSSALSSSFLATITVTEIAADGTRTKLAKPQLTYLAGTECSLSLGVDGGKQVRCAVKNDAKNNSELHVFNITLTETAAGGEPTIVAAPKIIVRAGQAGTIFVGREPGPAFEVIVLVQAASINQ